MNNVLFFLALLPTCFCIRNAMNYDPTALGLVELTNDNFKSRVLDQPGNWLVIFDGDMKMFDCANTLKNFCDQVKVSVSMFKEALTGLKGIGIQVGVVDYFDHANHDLVIKYQVDGIPTQLIFGKNKDKPILYNYLPTSSQDIIKTVKFLIEQPPPAKGTCGKDSGPSPNKLTYELNDDNFNAVVIGCPDPWVIVFYAPGLPICDQFLAKFEEAAKTQPNVKFGKFFQLLSKVADKYSPLHMLCTTVYFGAGAKTGTPIDYNKGMLGPSYNDGLVKWLQGLSG